jgi:hypothetical protein
LALIDGSIAAQLGSKRPLHLPARHLAKALTFACGESQQNKLAPEGFEETMTLAGQQSALSFELRAGLELAKLWIDQGQVGRAHDLIGPIYGRFTEGFATPDLIFGKANPSTDNTLGVASPGKSGVIIGQRAKA